MLTTLILRRLLILPLLLLLVSMLTFLLPYLVGMDPAGAILRARLPDRAPDPELLARIRQDLGLDQPLPFQYLGWLARLLQGDLGVSFVSRAPVAELLAQGFRVTLTLSVTALALAVVVGVPLGISAALRPGRPLDTALSALSQVGVAIPEYWLGPLLILIFAQTLGWLPSAGWREPGAIVLPAFVLALAPLAYCVRLTRESCIAALQADYVRTARAKGLADRATLYRHALPNALVPVVTMLALWFVGLLGGSVIVEVIFALSGLGRLLYGAVLAADIPLIQAALLLLTSIAVLVNTLGDMASLTLNPRLRSASAWR
jgi:peptide/nickel transport system permease protein